MKFGGLQFCFDEQKRKIAREYSLISACDVVWTDYAGYIKKAMFLLLQFRQLKRVQLSLLLDPEPEPEIEESLPEEPPLGLWGAILLLRYFQDIHFLNKFHTCFDTVGWVTKEKSRTNNPAKRSSLGDLRPNVEWSPEK